MPRAFGCPEGGEVDQEAIGEADQPTQRYGGDQCQPLPNCLGQREVNKEGVDQQNGDRPAVVVN